MPELAQVVVPVACVWSEPAAARPVDSLATDARPDLERWLSAMSHDDRLGLVGRLETQALLGDIVAVTAERDGWARVELLNQPSHKGSDGYPGWVPVRHLGHVLEDGPPWAVVSAPLARAGSETGAPLRLSAGTRLHRLGEGLSSSAGPCLLRSPTGAVLRVSAADLRTVRSVGPALLEQARLFSGLGYLWGGCSGYGLDCSGLAHLVHRAAGLIVPRDADDQAGGGRPVAIGQAAPGDLIFFARRDERTPHHVALWARPGRMLHSPGTGHSVEEIDQATEPYGSELMPTARRYVDWCAPAPRPLVSI